MTKEMITSRMKIISDLQDELRKLKAIYEESLESDATYQEVEEETVKVKQEVKEKKDRILENTSYKAMLDEIKEAQREIKEQRLVLSQELVDYYKENGTLEIEDHEGNVKRMQFSVKLVS